jgi:hypothetical protein
VRIDSLVQLGEMLRRLSEWHIDKEGSSYGTPWDPRDQDWEPGRVEFDWT